jgi:hypothetical protein
MTRLYALISSFFVCDEEGQGLAEYALTGRRAAGRYQCRPWRNRITAVSDGDRGRCFSLPRQGGR